MDGEERTAAEANTAKQSVLSAPTVDDHSNRVLRKGDLVRVRNCNDYRLKKRENALGRVIQSTSVDSSVAEHAFMYDVDFIMGGKLLKVERCNLLYTTAEQEGMTSDGTSMRAKRKRKSTVKDDPDPPPPAKKKVAPKKKKVATKAKPPSKTTAKAKRKATPATSSKKGAKKAKASKQVEIPQPAPSIAKDLFEKHSKEFDRCLLRLEKSDTFGFFYCEPSQPAESSAKEQPPASIKEEPDIPMSSVPGETVTPAAVVPSEAQLCGPAEANSALSIPLSTTPADAPRASSPTTTPSSTIQAPSVVLSGMIATPASAAKIPPPPDPFAKPPASWADIQKRKDAGRYVVNRLGKLEKDRKKRLGAFIWDRRKRRIAKKEEGDNSPKAENWDLTNIATTNKKSTSIGGKRTLIQNGVRVHPRVIHPKGIDWDEFKKDVIAMCNAAIENDPTGPNGPSGTPSHAGRKTRDMVQQYYDKTGKKQMTEMENDDLRHEFSVLIQAQENNEAAMQQAWRKVPFAERKYEQLKSDVVCAGLSKLDEWSAKYEKQTALEDSFVGLAYSYNDEGQSEGWMKSVLDKSDAKKKTQSSDGLTEEEKAANALAADDGVVRAQVRATMRTLLIGVQDKVMTREGILKQGELRSANWGDAAVDATPSNTSEALSTNEPDKQHSNIVERSVWGLDCYTRRNIIICLEKDFDSETAVEYIEKWLLPAVNACPVDIAHDIKNATLVLESLPLESDKHDKEFQNSLIGIALKDRIDYRAPVWLKAASLQLRRAMRALGNDHFRVHPKGHGSIVLSRKLAANTLVTFYKGEVYPSWRWGEKMDAIEMTQQHIGLRPNLPDFYNMALERPQLDPKGYGFMIVDASRKAGHGSMLSHSCDPTCEVRVAALNGQLCLAMTTLRDILQGEELTFDYNAVTESLQEYQAAVCLCGYNKCRGSFLHFATADCYQQVLNRNAPIAVRFSNLVKACTKKIMSEEDDRTLQTHRFGTAAFGAVSFDRHNHKDDGSPCEDLDSIPIWLRTYAADVLRYIEYERRALPISLLCDHFKTDSKPKKTEVKKKPAAVDKPSRPENSFRFYVRVHKEELTKEVGKTQSLKKLKGVELQQQILKVASSKWKTFDAAAKEKWKERAINVWKKGKQPEPKKTKPAPKKEKEALKEDDTSQELNLSKISFEAADAEGVSAMEQRVQQLTQSLSRIGRVLDRHREEMISCGEKRANSFHAPLAMLTDQEVISSIWCEESGVLPSLLRSIQVEKCVSPVLREHLKTVRRDFCVLEEFAKDPKGSGITSSEARTRLSEGLIKLRECLNEGVDDLTKEYRQYELQRGKHKAKMRRDEVKMADRREVMSVIQDLIDKVVDKIETPSDDGSADRVMSKVLENVEKANAEPPAMSKWLEYYGDRWKLEAAADILLMYARTSTFFRIVPYTTLESSPVEVYARELGNEVQRRKLKEAQDTKIGESTNIQLVHDSEEGMEEKTSKSLGQNLCDPDDTIAKVTVTYRGDYILAQLLQWYNGGIGQKPGLPDILGCLLLPSMDETFRSSATFSGKIKSTTVYKSKLRPRLFDWLRDPHQRGSSFPDELKKVFKQQDCNGKPQIVPIGSPVLDLLVMGDDTNLNLVLASLDEERLSDDLAKKVTNNGLESTVDEGMPAQAVANWVQCENPDCLKWRRLPFFADVDMLPEVFFCKDNVWNPSSQSCEDPEDVWDENDTSIRDQGVTKEIEEVSLLRKEYHLGSRFDVLRSGKAGPAFRTAEVIDTDFKSEVKRVKFHFPKVPDRYDEWIDLPSERIAPLYSRQFEKSEEDKAKDPEGGDANVSTASPKTMTFTDLTVPEKSETTTGKATTTSKTLTFTDLTVPEESKTQTDSFLYPNSDKGSRLPARNTTSSELPEPSISIVDSLLALRRAEPPREPFNPSDKEKKEKKKKRADGGREPNHQVDAVSKSHAKGHRPIGGGNDDDQSIQPDASAKKSSMNDAGRIPKKQKSVAAIRKSSDVTDGKESRVLLQAAQAVESGPLELGKIPRKPRNDTTKPENESPSRLLAHSIPRSTH